MKMKTGLVLGTCLMIAGLILLGLPVLVENTIRLRFDSIGTPDTIG